jgi:hypothetical protein
VQPRVTIVMVPHDVAEVKIHQFWTEVPSLFFFITQVPLITKMKTQKTKKIKLLNCKGRKPF